MKIDAYITIPAFNGTSYVQTRKVLKTYDGKFPPNDSELQRLAIEHSVSDKIQLAAREQL